MSDRLPNITLRRATVGDVPIIRRFIEALAEYEQLSHECVATDTRLTATLFGPQPAAEVVLALVENEPAGFALFFHNYSTFLAQPGLYLEDLFVAAAFRGRGVGRALLAHLANLAVQRDCGRLEWSVLDWNADAIRFYQSLGAQGMTDWTVHRLTGEAMRALAREDSGSTT
jgi:GNAT superfamily N-acetyltransferase